MATPADTTVPTGPTEISPSELAQAVTALTQAMAEMARENQRLKEEAARKDAEAERKELALRRRAELIKYKLPHETEEETVTRCTVPGIHWVDQITSGAGSHFLAPSNVLSYDYSDTGPHKFNLYGSSFRYHDQDWHRKLSEQGKAAEAEALAEDCTTAVHLRAMHRHLAALSYSLSALLTANPFVEGEDAGATNLRDGAMSLQAALTEAINSSFYNAKRVEMGAAMGIALAENNPGASVLRSLMSNLFQNVTQETTLRRMLSTFESAVRQSLGKQMAATEAAAQKRAAELRAEYQRGQSDARQEKAAAGYQQRKSGNGKGGNGKGGAYKGAPAAADRS